MQNKNIFIDANIFIDSKDDTRKAYEECFRIIPFLLQKKYKIYTSCDLITTIYYILSKIDKLKALDDIEQINKICKVIEFSNDEVSKTCKLMKENPKYKDFEDTIQYVLAKKEKCSVILSNDKSFYSDDIQVYTSTQYIKEIIK